MASFAGMEGVASYFQLKCLISNNRSWDFMDFCMIIVWSAMVEVNGGASDEDRKEVDWSLELTASTRDMSGHETHRASMATGNKVVDARFFGLEQGIARGVSSARTIIQSL